MQSQCLNSLSVTDTSTWYWGSVSISLQRNREARTCQKSYEAHSVSVSSDDERRRMMIFMTCEAQFQWYSNHNTHSHSNPSTVITLQTSCMMTAHEDAAAQLRCEEVMTSTVTQMQLPVRSVFSHCSTDHTECTWYTHTQSMMISFEGLSLVTVKASQPGSANLSGA